MKTVSEELRTTKNKSDNSKPKHRSECHLWHVCQTPNLFSSSIII